MVGLTAAVEQSVTVEQAVSVVTVAKRRPEAESLLAALGHLFTNGAEVDWLAALGGGRRVDLPTYAFQRQRFWLPYGSVGSADVSEGRPDAGGSCVAGRGGGAAGFGWGGADGLVVGGC